MGDIVSKFDELITEYDYLFQKQYRIDPFGVKLGSTDEAGNFKSDKVVSPKPILPTAILDNLDSEVQKVEIAWWESDRWKRTVTNRETLVNNSKITKLADRGVPVGPTTQGCCQPTSILCCASLTGNSRANRRGP